MGLDVHLMDKLCPGLYHSVTVTTDAGKPRAKVMLSGKELAPIVERLDTDIWKVRFLLPIDARGEVEITIEAGSHRTAEKRPVEPA
jgi:hypothetical protein